MSVVFRQDDINMTAYLRNHRHGVAYLGLATAELSIDLEAISNISHIFCTSTQTSQRLLVWNPLSPVSTQQGPEAHRQDSPSQHAIESRTPRRQPQTFLAFLESLITSNPFAFAVTVLFLQVRVLGFGDGLIELECDVAYQALLGGFLDLANFDLAQTFDIEEKLGMGGVDELWSTVSKVWWMAAECRRRSEVDLHQRYGCQRR
jgi:hypothetical protein